MKITERYIVNGKTFHSYSEVVEYAASLDLRITNTETLRKNNRRKKINSVYVITLNK